MSAIWTKRNMGHKLPPPRKINPYEDPWNKVQRKNAYLKKHGRYPVYYYCQVCGKQLYQNQNGVKPLNNKEIQINKRLPWWYYWECDDCRGLMSSRGLDIDAHLFACDMVFYGTYFVKERGNITHREAEYWTVGCFFTETPRPAKRKLLVKNKRARRNKPSSKKTKSRPNSQRTKSKGAPIQRAFRFR